MRAEGLELLLEAKKETGMPIVTEIMDASHIDLFENVDIIQVGARNMQNFELLKELGRIDKPIFLKRGLLRYASGIPYECRIHYGRGQPKRLYSASAA